MVIITGENGTVCEFEGALLPIPSKRNRVQKVMSEGTKRDSCVRVVKNYECSITSMTNENYKKLEKIFSQENGLLKVKDDKSNEFQNRMFIDLTDLKLTEVFNNQLGTKTWSGNLPIERR